ncbi:MAG: protein-L-isoaspartate(D-aspartate) O-methyltransferase [Helicobacteraceae bacterium]|nr:protein-L-isoaspartate(D-aspartate) O-methyltransferase [Helicobacteraceae bacterium]
MNDRVIGMKNSRLADDIHAKFTISDRVKDAIAKTNREAFVPTGFKHNAYRLDALPLSEQQWISSPLTVAKMTEYLHCDNSVDSVLEIGCGSGYQAAVLSNIFRRVFTIERIESLMIETKKRFRDLGINNVHTRTDDGQNGWIQYAPYDRIIFSATAKKVPQKIFDQLADGGILVAPVQKGSKEIIMRYFKRGDEIHEDELDECVFVPILDGMQSK